MSYSDVRTQAETNQGQGPSADPLPEVDRLVDDLKEAIESVEQHYRSSGLNWQHYTRCSEDLMKLARQFYDRYP